MPGRRPQPHADRRQQLLDAARVLFSEQPFDKVTTTAIAKRAGVAYGLIAHHFDNKRGLYLAVMNEIANEIAALRLQPPPPGTPPIEALRFGLRNHVAYVESHAQGFIALFRGQLGADRDQHHIIEELRWRGSKGILLALGVREPIGPILRAAMHGWVGLLDEVMIDRIQNDDVERDVIAELALSSLVNTLLTVRQLDPTLVVPSVVIEAFQSYQVGR